MHSGWLELVGMALAYAAYFGVRTLTEGDPSRAVRHAAELVRVERSLALDWEHRIQGVVLDRGALLGAADTIYVWGHWPVLIAAGCLLFRLRPAVYSRFRNALLLSGALGLLVFALFPVAPPRLASVGLQDTLRVHAGTDPTLFGPSLVNEYAAMPSFHFGWSLLLAIELCRATRRPLLRALALAMPLAMGFAVVATANHFILDVAGGSAVVLAALLILEHVRTRPPARVGAPRCGARTPVRTSGAQKEVTT